MAEEGQPAKKMRLGSGIVTIKAGTGDTIQDFPVHEDVIKEGSEFFKAAFDRKWREGQSRVLEMPEDAPETVSDYLEWLYSGQVKTIPNHNSTVAKRNARDQHLARMYVFGEKVQDNNLCNEIMRVFARNCDAMSPSGKRVPGDRAIRIIYDGTPSGSPARQFFVDAHVARAQAHWIGNDVNDYHPEFLLDIAKAMLTARDAEGKLDPDKHKAVEHIDKYLKKAP